MANTGVKDPQYDLISVLYHALQGAETLEQYIQDADNQEVKQYFQKVQQQYRDLAQQGKDLLKQRMS